VVQIWIVGESGWGFEATFLYPFKKWHAFTDSGNQRHIKMERKFPQSTAREQDFDEMTHSHVSKKVVNKAAMFTAELV
jgi:hypothetical protein